MYLMAIDIGSTSIKAAVYDYHGNLAASGRRKTEVVYQDQDGQHFAFWDPDNIWNCVTGSVKEAVSSLEKPQLIKGIAVTGFACDGVPIDKKGNCLYPFISWHDNRTLEQLEWFSQNADFKQIYKINGQKPWHLNTIFRNLWFKQNRPRLYEKIYKWLLIEDFINYKLCGEVATDYSLASTTLMLDQEKLEWSPELFDMFGLDMDIYPRPQPSGTYVGEVGAKAAGQTGLKEGTPVVLGGLDGLMGVYAAAGDQEDNLVGVIGTYEHYHKCMGRPILKEEGLDKSIICQAHVIKGKYGAYGVMVSSGVMEWFKDHLAGKEQLMAEKKTEHMGCSDAASRGSGTRFRGNIYASGYIWQHLPGSGQLFPGCIPGD
ncbi:MAG: FGGY family carbohydrate kinase [Actinomycetota bacterium]|nr:FGGY family carbohydrate kinase [Actinomycetota bacterium]